ncbi:MAG: Peptide/nickel transport system permease protein [Ignavibacteriaceae bacterium]|nr:Peptide/nickel transport system permease protein [Ignavibacteriaceae bacterium]
MKSGLKIIHWIIFLWLLLAVIRFELIIDYLYLILSYISLFFTDTSSAFAVQSFGLVDAFLSTLLFLLIIPMILFWGKRFRFLTGKLNFSSGFLIVLGFVFLFTPIISNENPDFSKNLSVTKLLPPLSSVKQFELKSDELSTDEFGRDLFVRLIYGTRISLTVGIGAVVLSFVIGIILGFIAGYRGGFPDILLNRFTEIFLAFPVIYLVVLILALFGSSIFSVIIVLGVSGWMSLFKIVKSEVL